MKRFFDIMIREFKLFSQNGIMLAVFILAPIVYSLLIGFVYKDAKVTDLPIVVVDLDQSPFSDNVIDALDDNQYLKVEKIKHEREIDKSEIILNNYQAVVTIPERFHADIEQKRHPEVNVEINAANMLTANYASTGIMRVLGTINAGIEIGSMQKGGMPPAIAKEQYESFQITTARFYNPASNYLMFLWPGMLGTIMQQVFLLTLALSFAKEIEDKTFSNLLGYSKNPILILMAKAIPYWVLGAALWFPLIKLSLPAFDIPLVEDKLAYWIISGLFVLSLTFLGIAVSIGLKSQLKATEVLMVIAAPSFIISGQTWPLHQMPEWVQWLANSIPLTHYLEAFRRLLLYEAGIHEVMPQIIGLAAITIISFLAAWLLVALGAKSHHHPIPVEV